MELWQTIDPRAVRKVILEQSKRAHVGHIASALSVADILAVLFSGVFRPTNDPAGERDLFILSKGHAALALYAVLHLSGVLSADQLDAYCADNSLLGVHPERELEGVDYSTGSLGHGISVAAGAAFTALSRRSSARTFVLASDAELNEGSTWEAIMFAGHHHLRNLVVVFDLNGQQALGRTRDVLELGDVAAKLREFGWHAVDVDGHDTAALRVALIATDATKPTAVVAHTIGGKGVSFMEGLVRWHYLPMTDDQFVQACHEIDHEKGVHTSAH